MGRFILFNEHEPVHVHGLYQGQECRADFTIDEGRGVEIAFHAVKGRRPLEVAHLNVFKVVVNQHADDIVRKWVDYFVLHNSVKSERIERRLK